jgi:Ni,Fe-hydrogenase I large subunit
MEEKLASVLLVSPLNVHRRLVHMIASLHAHHAALYIHLEDAAYYIRELMASHYCRHYYKCH